MRLPTCPRCCDPHCSGADCLLADAASPVSWGAIVALLVGLVLVAALSPAEPLLAAPHAAERGR